MKKGVRIAAWTVALLLLIQMGAVVVLQSPAVQTYLGKKAIGMLQEKLDAEISFGSASIRPFDALVLEDVLVMDPEPYVAGMDTLLYVRHLSARFSLMGLLSGESIRLRRANLDGGCFHLVIEPDSLSQIGTRTNLQRIFNLPPPEEDPEYHWGDLLQARSLEVRNIHYRMELPLTAAMQAERGYTPGPGTIDWNHLNLILEYLKVNRLSIRDDLIECDARDLTVQELETGLRMEGLSARKVRVGKGNVHLDEFTGRLSHGTTLQIPSMDMTALLDDYDDFENNVRLDVTLGEGTQVDMRTISHFAPGLDKMGFRGRIRGRFDGPVSDFRLLDMVVDGLDEDIHVKATGRMQGLPDAENTRLDFRIGEMLFSMEALSAFVRDWAPEVQLDAVRKLAPGESFTLTGTVGGTLNNMDVNALIGSRIGEAGADIHLRNVIDNARAISIGGTLETDRLNLGTLLGQKELGPLTMHAGLDASFPAKGPQVQLDSLHIASLSAHGYEYSRIGLSGNYRTDGFRFRLRSDDPNLQVRARGLYHETPERDGFLKADLQLDRADLQALNLDGRGKSLVALNAAADIRRENAHARGSVTASGIQLVNDSGLHPVDDIVLHLDAVEGNHRLKLESAMMDASYRGGRAVTDFAGDLVSLAAGVPLPALLREHAAFSGTAYEAQLSVRDIRELLAFALPGAYVENGTQASLSVTPDGQIKADVQSGRIALREKFVKDLALHVGNDEKNLTAEMTGGILALGNMHLNNNRLTLQAGQNRVGLGYTFDNETEDDTRAELYLSGALDRDEKGLGFTATALPSNLYYKGNGWSIHSGEVLYRQGRLHIDQFTAQHEEQQLLIDGGYSPGKADTLSLTMDHFELGLVNTIVGEGLPPLEGQLTGRARVLSSASSEGLLLLAGIVCDSTSLGGKRIGELRLSSILDEATGRFRVRLHNRLDGREALSAHAAISPETRQVEGTLKLDRFGLGAAEPFLNTVFHAFDGALSGDVSLNGKWNDLHISGENLHLDDGLLCLDFNRVPYRANGTMALDNDGLHFRDVAITDGEKGTGVVSGGILFKLRNLQDIRMDTHIRMQNMRALALPRGVNPLLWGDIYAGGKVDVTGPLNRLTVALDVTNTREGVFHLPLGSSGTGSSTELLTFTRPASSLTEDLYELMMAREQETHAQTSDFRFTGRIRATPELQVNLDLDEDNTLTAYGSGTIEMESRASQGIFTLGGDYVLTDGSFHFSAMNLVNRNFSILDGSAIRFNGEVWDTDLDVKGRYVTKASLSNLLPSYDDEKSASSRHTVYCGISISGKLKNPVVDFTIDVPDLNPVVQSQVENALNSPDKVQKQFVYLLIAGNFLPTDESGVTTNGSEVLYSNVSSIMSGQLNNIFQKLDIPLDLGLNYQTNKAGQDIFDVAVSTQLFNNRVIVNGTVGNKQILGGLTNNELAGNLDIEIKLNRSGSLRVSLFSHSADQYTYYLDNSQRNGGGIAYQREFNTLVQFFRELFAGPARREQMALEAAMAPADNVRLQVDEKGNIYEQQ